MSSAAPTCHGCRHYFVTWDKIAPHGCRAFEFKSPEVPCVVVERASDMPCGEFDPRPARTSPSPGAPTGSSAGGSRRLDVTT